MLFNTNLLAVAALLVAGVHANTPSGSGSAAAPTSTSQIPPCVLSCAETALQGTDGSCTSITSPCICTNTQFQQAAAACLQSKCSASDQAAALQLQQAVCGSSSSGTTAPTSTGHSHSSEVYPSSSTSGSSSGPGTTSGSGSGTSTGTSTSSSASSSSSKSAGDKITFGQTGLFAIGVSVFGAVIGGLMV